MLVNNPAMIMSRLKALSCFCAQLFNKAKHHQSRRRYAKIATVQRKTAETVTRSLLIIDRSWFDFLVLASLNRQIMRLWLRRDDQTLKL